jgi:hypothetical protein
LARDGGEDDFGGGHREIGAMVFPNADEIDAQLVGEHGFVDNVADYLGL